MRFRISDLPHVVSPTYCEIFNTVAYYKIHENSNSVFLSVYENEEIVSVCHFNEIEPGVFVSPYKGTFGGIDFCSKLDIVSVEEVILLIVNFLIKKSAKRIVLNMPPFCHNPGKSAYFLNNLLLNKFIIERCEINHHIIIDEVPLFEKMMRNNKKRLKKCISENFIFQQVHSIQEYSKVYDIIKRNRSEKGYDISMTFEQIMKMKETFHAEVYFFKTTFDFLDVASSICIRINSNVLYVFYWGDLSAYKEYSPIVHLANGIYDFAKENNYKMLDAGTSSIKGELNYGLCKFKENLGFSASNKLSFRYDI